MSREQFVEHHFSPGSPERGLYRTKGMAKMLVALARGKDLVYEKDAGWWVGNARTSGGAALKLIRLCLVSYQTPSGSLERYEINSEGKALLNDPNYVPEIVKQLGADVGEARYDAL